MKESAILNRITSQILLKELSAVEEFWQKFPKPKTTMFLE